MHQKDANYRIRCFGMAAGMSQADIIDDFPELTAADIKACLEFVADRERRLVAVVSAA